MGFWLVSNKEGKTPCHLGHRCAVLVVVVVVGVRRRPTSSVENLKDYSPWQGGFDSSLPGEKE